MIIKLLMYPLSTAQYKSMAKMRKFQPRIKQLQERYGDDKQKLQMAMMELYKKEKINPVGGCLPILLQMPVFLRPVLDAVGVGRTAPRAVDRLDHRPHRARSRTSSCRRSTWR